MLTNSSLCVEKRLKWIEKNPIMGYILKGKVLFFNISGSNLLPESYSIKSR